MIPDISFTLLEQGLRSYLEWLEGQSLLTAGSLQRSFVEMEKMGILKGG
jgi:hypothetical protein